MDVEARRGTRRNKTMHRARCRIRFDADNPSAHTGAAALVVVISTHMGYAPAHETFRVGMFLRLPKYEVHAAVASEWRWCRQRRDRCLQRYAMATFARYKHAAERRSSGACICLSARCVCARTRASNPPGMRYNIAAPVYDRRAASRRHA